MTNYFKNRAFKHSMYVALFIALSLLTACGNAEDEHSSNHATEAAAEENELISVSAEQFKMAHFELGKISPHNFNEVIKTNGMFDVAPENKAVISAFFGGYIKELKLLPGQEVRKGQTVAILENPDYAKLQQDFLEAKGSLNHLKGEYERQKNLVADNSTSQKNFLRAEADYNVTRSRFESLKKQLQMMNINPDQLTNENIRTQINITSPISGFVTHVGAATGMYVSAQSPMLTVINTDHMHLELNIYEKDLPFVRVGQQIKFHVQNNAHEEHFGEVYLINQAINEENRTVSVHGHVEDEHPTEIFIPGMYIEAEIYTSSQSLPALPEEAVVEIENKSFVLIKTSATDNSYTFEQREVIVGKTSDGFVQILNAKDFTEGTEFLTKGAFNLMNDGGSVGHSH